MIIKISTHILLSLVFFMPLAVSAAEIPAHEIVYVEKEEGTDFYTVKYTVSEHSIRIDDSAEPDEAESGFIIFDLKKEIIYSVSHFDKTILVIPKYDYSSQKNNIQSTVTYEKLDDAPSISGKQVFTYKLLAKTDNGLEKCLDLQIASGLWLDVTAKLKQYQTVVAGQQIKTIDTIPNEYQTACYMLDQVFNKGDYYDKGLPVHEWHSNNRVRYLKSFEKVVVYEQYFLLPKEYKQFTLEELKH